MEDVNVSHDNIRASRVNGTSCYNRAGESLGTVDDLVIGKRDGRVKYAIMSFGGFLGLGEEYHVVPWEKLDYETSQGGYVLDMTKEQLEGAPRYTRDREPDWNDRTFGRDLDTYYGVPPVI